MEGSLLKRVHAGDMGAMQECMDEYGGLIWSLARRFCPSLSEAEDAVQEVFIALWENADRFDAEKGAEVTFVATIARRRLIDRARRHARGERAMNELKKAEAAQPQELEEDVLDSSDDVRRAQEAFDQLSPEQQRVLHLAVHRSYTHEQIARITELPLGTVKTHARRGLMRVRALLDESTSDSSVSSDQ